MQSLKVSLTFCLMQCHSNANSVKVIGSPASLAWKHHFDDHDMFHYRWECVHPDKIVGVGELESWTWSLWHLFNSYFTDKTGFSQVWFAWRSHVVNLHLRFKTKHVLVLENDAGSQF